MKSSALHLNHKRACYLPGLHRLVRHQAQVVGRKRVAGGYIWQEWIRNMRGNEERTRERLIAWMAEEDDKARRGELMRLIEHCTQNLEWLQRMEDFNGGG